MHRAIFAFVLAAASGGVAAEGADVFVDNLTGSDIFDGRVSKPMDAASGPVRSLRRAMQIAQYGDRVILTRPGAVYYDSLSLTGPRNSGSKNFPFTIIGNGATLSGMRAVPPEGWQKAGSDLWKLTLTRKGYYRLFRDGQPLIAAKPYEGERISLESLSVGQWTAQAGSLYYRGDGEAPSTQSFSYAAEQTGLTLYQVENVLIKDLTFRDFRFDGIHAQNMCRQIQLENVTCMQNGRAGVAVSGTSRIEINGGRIDGNGQFQIRIASPAQAELHNVSMDGEPAVVP